MLVVGCRCKAFVFKVLGIINLKKNIGCTQKLPTKKREDIIDGNYKTH
jgi:hypothetical protein